MWLSMHIGWPKYSRLKRQAHEGFKKADLDPPLQSIELLVSNDLQGRIITVVGQRQVEAVDEWQ